jgi:hypothetical protein
MSITAHLLVRGVTFTCAVAPEGRSSRARASVNAL